MHHIILWGFVAFYSKKRSQFEETLNISYTIDKWKQALSQWAAMILLVITGLDLYPITLKDISLGPLPVLQICGVFWWCSETWFYLFGGSYFSLVAATLQKPFFFRGIKNSKASCHIFPFLYLNTKNQPFISAKICSL